MKSMSGATCCQGVSNKILWPPTGLAERRSHCRQSLSDSRRIVSATSSCESITGPIARTISRSGLLAVRDQLTSDQQKLFDRTYSATYHPVRQLIVEIYDEVDSGNELRSVVSAARRLAETPIGTHQRIADVDRGSDRTRAAG